eukprot:762026-Hanusia_phi.AAC.8
MLHPPFLPYPPNSHLRLRQSFPSGHASSSGRAVTSSSQISLTSPCSSGDDLLVALLASRAAVRVLKDLVVLTLSSHGACSCAGCLPGRHCSHDNISSPVSLITGRQHQHRDLILWAFSARFEDVIMGFVLGASAATYMWRSHGLYNMLFHSTLSPCLVDPDLAAGLVVIENLTFLLACRDLCEVSK